MQRSKLNIRFYIILSFLLIALKPLKADVSVSGPLEVFEGYDIYATTIVREGNVWKQRFGGWMTVADLPWDRMYYSYSEDSGNTWSDPIEVFTITNVQINDPSVIRLWDNDNAQYYYQMYYTYYPSGLGDETNYIAVSTSVDGINWSHLGELIGADNGIDMDGAWAPSAVSLDSLGNEIYLYFHNNHPDGQVYRTTLSGKGLVFDKETTISVTPSGPLRANVDVSISPDGTWWMYYNGSAFTSTGEGIFNTCKMYSEDGVNWVESYYNPIQEFADSNTVTPFILWQDTVNYQLWHGYGTHTFLDFDVYMQAFQKEVEPDYFPVVASSEALVELAAENVIDNEENTFWSSRGYIDNIHNEWIYLDFDETKVVHQVILTPRSYNNVPTCFPFNFSLQYSLNGIDWADINGQSHFDYNSLDILPEIFTFDGPVTAQYIRLNAEKLSADPFNNFYCQIAEFNVVNEVSDILLNNNPYLSSIKVDDTEISNFSPDNFEYGIDQVEGTGISVAAIPLDSNATVNIVYEADKVTIQVTAENNINDTTYVLNINYISAVNTSSKNKIKIFPNPAKDNLTITNAENSNLFIYTLKGELVYGASCDNMNHIIDVDNFIPGLYLIKINKNGLVNYRKVLIQ